MENKEYTVTIPIEEYKDLIRAQNELDNIIDFIFNLYDYDGTNLCFAVGGFYLLDKYLKSLWGFTYNKTLNRLKEEYKKESE
jgi:hypothetical protein